MQQVYKSNKKSNNVALERSLGGGAMSILSSGWLDGSQADNMFEVTSAPGMNIVSSHLYMFAVKFL